MVNIGVKRAIGSITVLFAVVSLLLNIVFVESVSAKTKKGANSSSIFVSPHAKSKKLNKVAVLPFKAPVELAGASIADVFTTEILKTYKYRLIERSQMEQVLDEKALGLQGVISSSEAIQIGKLLGVEGVILGTVPEYGLRANGANELPSVGINVRMISVNDGSIVWSVSDSALGKATDPISSFAVSLVQRVVQELQREWIRQGDTIAINLPTISPSRVEGGVREVMVTLPRSSKNVFTSYRVYRSRIESGEYQYIGVAKNASESRSAVYTDSNLLDDEQYFYKVVGVAPSGLNGPLSAAYKATTVGPPSAVLGFNADSNKARKVPLTWNSASEPHIKGYDIYRSINQSGPFRKITQVRGATKTSYLDKGGKQKASLDDYQDYFYRIHAVNVVDVQSIGSPIISARTKPLPEPVTGFSAKSNGVKEVALSWNQNAERDIAEYRIYTGKKANSVKRLLKKVSASETSFMHKRLLDGKEYFYRIVAIDQDKLVSETSDIIYATTKPRPQTPSGFVVNLNDETISLSWNDNSERDIKNYEIKTTGRFLLNKGSKVIATSETSHVFSGLKPGGSGSFKIRAIDETGLASDYTTVKKIKIPKAETVDVGTVEHQLLKDRGVYASN